MVSSASTNGTIVLLKCPTHHDGFIKKVSKIPFLKVNNHPTASGEVFQKMLEGRDGYNHIMNFLSILQLCKL